MMSIFCWKIFLLELVCLVPLGIRIRGHHIFMIMVNHVFVCRKLILMEDIPLEKYILRCRNSLEIEISEHIFLEPYKHA